MSHRSVRHRTNVTDTVVRRQSPIAITAGRGATTTAHSTACARPGSGTIVIEAETIATRRAQGLNRPFAFERLANFDRAAWRRLKERAAAAVDDAPTALIVCSDISTRVVEQARTNAKLAGLDAFLGDGRLRSGWEGMQAARLVPCQLFGRIAPRLLLACLKIDAAYGRDYRRVT